MVRELAWFGLMSMAVGSSVARVWAMIVTACSCRSMHMISYDEASPWGRVRVVRVCGSWGAACRVHVLIPSWQWIYNACRLHFGGCFLEVGNFVPLVPAWWAGL
jgi:hypothetical protein